MWLVFIFLGFLVFSVGAAIKGAYDRAAHDVGFFLILSAILVLVSTIGSNCEGYKRGQIDYINGKIQFKKVVTDVKVEKYVMIKEDKE